MKKILLLGAGLSASTLIEYLLEQAEINNWKLRIGDKNIESAKNKINGHKHGEFTEFDINNLQQTENEIQNADIVISLLPASLHIKAAKVCLKYGKNLATASYVSEELKALAPEVKKKGLLFLNEIGVDPGIDHMSAMKIIDRIKEAGGNITSFKSYCGGLVAPQYDNTPWNYKFTWNPRNVVVAGQGSPARFLENNSLKIVPYQRLFKATFRTTIKGYGEFEGYPNRDSLKYRPIYKLNNTPTLLRGTLRRPGYSRAWDSLVQLGMTDDNFKIADSNKMTYREFTECFLPKINGINTEEKTANFLGYTSDDDRMYKLRWLGLFDDIPINIKNGSPAQILQEILLRKWTLSPEDKDMLAMQHIFEYELNGQRKELQSSMVITGKDTTHTAMSMTVGLPLGIAVKMVLTDVIKCTGVVIPIVPEIYNPVLKELENYDISFIEKERSI